MQVLSIESAGIPLWRLLIIAGFLIPALAGDIKERKISLIPCIIGTASGIITGMLTGMGIRDLLFGLIPGLAVIVISILLKGTIGTGDGVILTMLGSFLGLWRTVTVLFTALMISMIVALVLLMLKKVSGKTEFPFVPFICAGFVVSAFI